MHVSPMNHLLNKGSLSSYMAKDMKEMDFSPSDVNLTHDSSSKSCRDDLYLNTCLPECGKWTYPSHNEDRVITTLHIAGSSFGIVITVAFIIIFTKICELGL